MKRNAVAILVALCGVSLFVKTGDGQLALQTNAFHTGGTRLIRGKFSVSNRYCKPQFRLFDKAQTMV